MTRSRDIADSTKTLDVDGGTIKLDGNYPNGTNNVGLGDGAFAGSLSGDSNVAIGYQSHYSLTSGNANTSVGRGSGFAITTGTSNVAVGYTALSSNTTASSNTAVGYQAGYNNTTGTENIAVGVSSLYTNTTGNYNTVAGSYSMRFNTTGSDNSAFGQGALYANTSGNYSVAVGRQSLFSNTTASYNTAVGYQAGYATTTGLYNTYLGYKAGITNTTSNSNTFVGVFAGEFVTGNTNTFVGESSGYAMTTGSKNTIIGKYNGNQGGLDIRTSSNNIVLSDGDGNPRIVVSGSGDTLVGCTNVSSSSVEGVKFRVGHNAKTIATVSNRSTSADEGITMWSTGANTWRFYVGWGGKINATSNTIQAISDQRFKENIRDLDDGLSKVMELRPRKFDWKEGKGADIRDDRGFIAQEFEEVFPDLVGVWKDEPPEGEEPYKAVSQDLIPTLVKAIQELSAKNDELEARITALEA